MQVWTPSETKKGMYLIIIIIIISHWLDGYIFSDSCNPPTIITIILLWCSGSIFRGQFSHHGCADSHYERLTSYSPNPFLSTALKNSAQVKLTSSSSSILCARFVEILNTCWAASQINLPKSGHSIRASATIYEPPCPTIDRFRLLGYYQG